MRILLLGSGGREHALALALAADPIVTSLTCAPGNPGIAAVRLTDGAAVVALADLDLGDVSAIAALAVDEQADLVVVGPEVPLVAGAADAVRAVGVACFGPSSQAAQIEGSKAFAKDVMVAAGVPTAGARVCTTLSEVRAAFDDFGAPHVVKDDGLAAGKGVVVTGDHEAAMRHARAVLDAGHQVVVEDFLDGPEVSLFVVTDGTVGVPLLPAQDFKRIGDGDTGPNTGGMGAYAPLDWAPKSLVDDVMIGVVTPTLAEMRRRGAPFAGVLYVGLALTSQGPKVIEFNCRFGDPETQVVLALLATPLAGLLHAGATGALAAHPPLRWRDGAAVTVVVASSGYPLAVRTGDVLAGIESAGRPAPGVIHAGTARRPDGALVSAGGRVVCATAVGGSLVEARDAAYAIVDRIELAGSQHRTDIAAAAIDGRITLSA